MTIVQETPNLPEPLTEVKATRGGAYAIHRPNGGWPEVNLLIAGQPVACSPAVARDALAVLAELFGPLAESRRVAARVAAMGEGGGQRG